MCIISFESVGIMCTACYLGNGENPDIHEGGTKAKYDPHIQVEFSDSLATFTCKVYFADEFHSLREIVYPPGEEK